MATTGAAATLLTLNIPIFEGQGTSTTKYNVAFRQVSADARGASGSLLLKSCHEAFLEECTSLTSDEILGLGLDVAAFTTPESLLSSTEVRNFENAVIAGTTVFLIHALRYLAHVESFASSSGSTNPFTDILHGNIQHRVGIAGFSSGVLAASLVATSRNRTSFLSHAVEIYRLAFWIGVRVQLFRVGQLRPELGLKWQNEPWSRVFMDIDAVDLSARVSEFNADRRSNDALAITAVINDSTVTISARPDSLASFVQSLPEHDFRIQKSDVYTLYHCASLAPVKAQILQDVARRSIQLPSQSQIFVPLRSTINGEPIDVSTGVRLVDSLLDMIITEPVNWDKVTLSIAKAIPSQSDARLLNFGPGSGLCRLMSKGMSKENVSVVDEISPAAGSDAGSLNEPVAIVGMAVNMPGAPNLAKLWEVLEQGINTVCEVPSSRFDISQFNGPDALSKGRFMKTRTGNFIDDPSLFDNKFFRISPREAKSMDPQQRILLHAAQEALDDAGYVPNATPSFQQDSFACYVGAAGGDWVDNLRENVDVYYSTGTLRSFMSGRISYAMKLSGPSVVLDTACAASVVTIYLACRALMNGDCTAALAGGVNTISSPDMTLGLDRAHFLSPTGQCKPWDISADGYSRSEGVGLFVLKKLSDAVRENDRILGVIRGVEVNHSGEAQSITHPHAPTQFALYERLLRRSGVDRGLVNVIEAHGTGTQAGDPNELEGLRRAFASSSVTGVKRTKDNPLHITSVKANIGHLEAASGSASLAKLLLMMKHRTIPRVVSLRNLNPSIKPLEGDGVCIARQNMEWVPAREGMPRVALLNNFGAAGQNAALLVEEYIAPPRKTNDVQASHSQALPLLFGASAKDKEALYRLRDRYVELLEGEEGEGVNLVDVAYTATARRQVYESRFVVTASTKEELVANLKHAVVQPNCPLSSSAKAIFMFSGQGGQYLGMGRSLYTTVPKFRKDIDLCHRTLVDMGFPGILDIIQADGSKSGLDKLVEFEAYQASVFSLQYALAQLWISWGIQPAAVVGHSIGEYAALVIAGVLDLRSALFVVASRVRLMVQKCPVETTGMLAVNMKPEDASRILSTESSVTGVTIACFNSPVDVVLGGPVEALKRLKGNFDAERLCKSVLLSVPYGYHTDAMLPITTDLNAVGDSVAFRAPKIPVVSNVTGAVVEPGNSGYFTAEYFSEHCMQPVQFTEGIQALMASPLVDTKCCIEIGPHPTTIPMLKVNPMVTERETWFAWSLRKNEDHWKTLSESLATMYMRGMPLQWRRVYEHLSPTCIELPSYPFSYSSFWVQYREYIGATPTNVPVAPVQSNNIHAYTALDKWIQYPSAENEYEAVFESSMGPLVPLITGHGVGDHPLCPASVYHEIVLSGIRLASRELEYEHEKDVTVLKSVEYLKPLVYTENDTRILRTRVTHVDTNGGSFTVSSCYPESEAETVHCSGEFQVRDSEKSATKFQRHEPILLRDIDAVCSNTGSETFSTRTVYQVIFPRVVSYSEAYHTVRKVFVHPNGYDAYAIARVDESRSPGNFIVNPIFMDTVLHVSGFVANMRADTLDALICNQVDSVKIFSEKLDLSLEYGVYTQSAWIAEENSVIADAYAIALPSRRIVGHIKGIHFRKLRLASIKRALSLSAGVSTSHHPPASLNPRPAMITSSTSIKTALNHHASVSASRHVSRAKTQTNAATLPSKNAMPSTRESDIWTAVLDIIASTCGISLSELDSNADLSALGVDSLMGIEMSSRLQASFPDSTFDARALLMLSTPAQIAQEVMSKTLSIQADGVATDSSLSGSAHLDESNIITAVATPRSTPSVLSDIHDDISVRAIIASMLELNAQEIEDDDDLESLGMDSLSAMESLDALRKATQMKLPSNLFEIHTTVRAVDKYISSMKNSTRPRPDFVTRPLQLLDSTTSGLPFGPIPVPIQRSGNDNIPLFLIHDGSGLINHYERMISIDRDVWGIYNPNFNGNEEWSDIESMATHYSKLIDETVPAGPMLIGGWSFGGVVAYEITRCLLSLGRDVQGILLIDPPSPVGHVPLSEALLQEILSRRGSGISSNAARLVRRQFKLNSGLMGRYSTKTQHDIVPVKVAFLRSQEGLSLTGTIPVPKWLADRSNVRDAVVGWEPLVRGPIEVLDIPGNHFEPFLPANIEEVSRKIVEGCHLVTM